MSAKHSGIYEQDTRASMCHKYFDKFTQLGGKKCNTREFTYNTHLIFITTFFFF